MIWLLIITLSAIFGSFANVLIHRLPLMILSEDNELSLSQPTSHCPMCLTPLRWWHNIPLVSFIVLRRRCAQCHALIAWRYFLVELGSVFLGVFCALYWGWTIFALASFVFLYLLWALSWIDALHYLLPDLLTHILLWSGLLYQAIYTPSHLVDAVFAVVLGFMLLYTVYMLFYIFTRKQGLGFGDMKLLAALGAWLGMAAIANVLIVACALAFLYVLQLRLKGRALNNKLLPFGPFLALAGAVILVGRFDVAACLAGVI